MITRTSMRPLWFLLACCWFLASSASAASSKGKATTEPEVTCSYGGKTYGEGETIPVPDDVCLYCECRQGWTTPSDLTCGRIDCPFSVYDDCEPTYTDGQCCPTWNCPEHSSTADPVDGIGENQQN